MKAGGIDEEMSYYKLIYKGTEAPDLPCLIRQLRARRKELIREALEAYETEKLVAQASAYERGFCDGLRINETTKTQHT